MKGMVLAAGFGTRLRPLTNILPKPLFPVCNAPLVDYALHRLHELSIDRVVVNLHYLSDPIRAHLADGSRFEQRIDFSEEPRILGTGGGIKAVRDWARGERLVVTNADALLMADLSEVVEAHEKSGALATMAVMADRRVERYGAVTVDQKGFVTDIAGELQSTAGGERGIFVGFHIIEPELFDLMPDRDHFCIVRDVYMPLIKNRPGAVRAHFVDGLYFDAGTPADYLLANFAVLTGRLNPKFWPTHQMRHLGEHVFIGDNVHLGRGVRLKGPCIVGNDVRIEGGSEIGPVAAVGSGALLGPWTRLTGCVAWPKTLLPGGGLHHDSILYDREVFAINDLP